jgi:hypothetical protein
LIYLFLGKYMTYRRQRYSRRTTVPFYSHGRAGTRPNLFLGEAQAALYGGALLDGHVWRAQANDFNRRRYMRLRYNYIRRTGTNGRQFVLAARYYRRWRHRYLEAEERRNPWMGFENGDT